MKRVPLGKHQLRSGVEVDFEAQYDGHRFVVGYWAMLMDFVPAPAPLPESVAMEVLDVLRRHSANPPGVVK